MKTLKQIESRIADLERTGNATHNEKEKNRCRRELKIARAVKMYLEFGPTQESVDRQLIEAVANIDRINLEFEYAFPVGCDAKRKSEFMKGKGLPELKKQVKTIKYML